MAAQQQLQIQLNQFWKEQLEQIQAIDPDKTDFKTHELPLARIKKIMKMDDEIDPAGPRFMISAEAPAVFAKACEIFILELTLRSWTVTEESKRRTLQRTDVAQAVQRSDMYDFLIDIVPREEVKQPAKKVEEQQQQARAAAPQHGVQLVDSTQYIYLQQQSPGTAQAIQIQHLLWQQQLAQQAYVIQTQQQQPVGVQGVAPPPLPPLPDNQQQQQPPPPPSQRMQDGRSREQDEEEDDDDDDDEDDEEEGEEEEGGAPSASPSHRAAPPPLPSHQSPAAGLGVRQDRRPPPPAHADGRASHLLHVVPVGGGGTGASSLMSAPPHTQPRHDAPPQLPNGHSSNSSQQQQAGRGRQLGF